MEKKMNTTTEKQPIKTFSLNGKYSLKELMLIVRENSAEYFKRECVIKSVENTKEFLKQALSFEDREVFAVMFLDNKHRLIKFEIMSVGTIDSASVFPREIVKRALELNCSCTIFSHNHPAGDSTPSKADINITNKLQLALDTVDIRVLDHVVVSDDCTSFAELGLIESLNK
jgi:DNA repair protein RadC